MRRSRKSANFARLVPQDSYVAAASRHSVSQAAASVAGVYSSINYGVRPLAALVGGVLAVHVGLRVTFLVVAVGGSLSLLWFLASPIPRIKSLDMIDSLRA